MGIIGANSATEFSDSAASSSAAAASAATASALAMAYSGLLKYERLTLIELKAEIDESINELEIRKQGNTQIIGFGVVERAMNQVRCVDERSVQRRSHQVSALLLGFGHALNEHHQRGGGDTLRLKRQMIGQ
jgi:hypothetical protein